MNAVTIESDDVKDQQPSIDAACEKKSFLKFDLDIDKERLLEEYNQIPAEAWGSSL